MRSLLLASTAAAALGLGLAAPAGAFDLTILHTNDVHDRFEPINKYSSTCSEKEAAEKACFGGAARLATAIDEGRAAGGNVIVLDAGDWFQGTLFYTQYKGKATSAMVDSLGYDAMAVGNHEFDDGPGVLAGFARDLKIPLLSANIDPANEKALPGDLILPSTVIEVGGEKIGVIGLTTPDTPDIASTGEVAFEPPAVAVKREVDALTAQGVNKIVVLSHLGYVPDQKLASEVDGIDVIVGGHSHTLLGDMEGAEGKYPTLVKAPDGTEVPIVTAQSYSKYLGDLTVTFDDAGKVTAATGAPRLLDASVAEDPETLATVKDLAKPLDEIRNKVVASIPSPIDGSRETCRQGECQMGNLVADALLERTAPQGVTIALLNGGGLRASIDAGEVTQGEILTVLPFLNTVATFELTGQGIIDALENGVSQVEEGGGRFPQVAGLQVDWSQAPEPGQGRIKAVRVRQGDAFVPIDPAKTYSVVSNDFMRRGGDGYDVFVTAKNAYDFGPPMDQVVADYLASKNGAYTPYLDGRITKVE